MARLSTSLVAATLIASGAFADHMLTPSLPGSGAAAATIAPAAISSSTTSADAATVAAFAKASPSVVYISNVGIGSGSGVIYDTHGNIVTNAHVVANEQALRVTLSTGKIYAAHLVGTDTADDLAVIHIDASGLPAAHFAGAGGYKVAQTVLAIGNPLDLKQSVTSGLISAINRTVSEGTGSSYLPDAIQTSAPINPGNSGGALVTLDGSVVGIPTLEASDPQNNNGGAAQGIGFAIPSSRVTEIAHQLITTGHVQHTGRAYLGVAAIDASAVQQQSQFGNDPNSPTLAGAAVRSVGSGSPAERAGIQQGDVITAVNGHGITGESDLLTTLAHAKPGSNFALTVSRGGSNTTVTVRLGELSA